MAKAKKSKAELQADLSAGKSIAEVAAATEGQEIGNCPKPEPTAPVAVEPKKEKGPGKIAQILAHFKSGKTTKEISALPFLDENGSPVVTGKDENGNEIFETFHPTTISIQVNKFKKMNPDIYPPLPPAPTKKEIAEQKKAEKAAAAALAAANAPQPQTEASAVASDGTPA
jgi:hypothetical protein